jgi:hypothetical protein
MTDHPQTPMTHTAWAPFFDDDGNLVRSVEIGYGIFEADANGEVMGRIFRDRQVVGYDSGYICLASHGKQPPAPPPDFDRHRLSKLIGEAALSEAGHNPEVRAKLKAMLDRHITDPEHRALLRAEGLL